MGKKQLDLGLQIGRFLDGLGFSKDDIQIGHNKVKTYKPLITTTTQTHVCYYTLHELVIHLTFSKHFLY